MRDGDARWSAWVVDLEVDRATGDVAVRRVVAGQGAGAPGDASMAGLPAWQIEAAISRVMGRACPHGPRTTKPAWVRSRMRSLMN